MSPETRLLIISARSENSCMAILKEEPESFTSSAPTSFNPCTRFERSMSSNPSSFANSLIFGITHPIRLSPPAK